MSRARISRAKTFAPVTFDVPSMRYFRTPSFHAGRVNNCSSNNDAKALLPRGARYTARPPIRLAPITCRRDGCKRFMRMAPVQGRSRSARRQYRDRLDFQKCALARKLGDLEGGAGGRRGDVHELIAHLPIDRKLRANVGQKGVKVDDVFHLAADALDRSFQVFVDQRRLLAEIRA